MTRRPNNISYYQLAVKMSYRGRGVLEIKPSTNPFFQSSNQEYGASPQLEVNWKHDVNPSLLQTAVDATKKEDFSFLYTRTSDCIGSRIGKSELFLPQQPTKTG